MRWGIKVVAALVLALCLAPASAWAAAPVNDDFANREAIEGTLPLEVTRSNVEATREYQYEEVGSFAAGHSVWFKWTSDVDGWVTVDTCTASFQTVLGIFTGSDVEHLTRVTKGNMSEVPGCFASGRKYAFKAVSGTEYEFGVDGNGFYLPEWEPPVTEGEFTLRIEETPAPTNDDFADAAAIPDEVEEEPDGTRRYRGSATGYNWKATTEPEEQSYGTGSGASVWYSWTPPETAKYHIGGACCGTGLGFALFSGDSLGELTEIPLGEFGEVDAIAGAQYWIAAYGKEDAETSEATMGSFNLYIMASLAPNLKEPPASSPTANASQPSPDTTAPETTIDKSRFRIAARTATFWFSASEATQGFLCRLDKGDFKPCGSPRTYKRLKPGKHAFRVKAVDAAGNVDSSAAVAKFKIPKPSRGRR